MTQPDQADRPARVRERPPVRKTVHVQVTDARGMVELRAIAYVLVSLASVVFLLLVVIGYVKYQQLAGAVEQLGSSFGTSSTVAPRPLPTLAPVPLPPAVPTNR